VFTQLLEHLLVLASCKQQRIVHKYCSPIHAAMLGCMLAGVLNAQASRPGSEEGLKCAQADADIFDALFSKWGRDEEVRASFGCLVGCGWWV
jgi:hypothetical protein